MIPPVLSIAGLNVSFRVDGAWRRVVEDLSFDICPRETVAIVGESGSGKSVTALSTMGLLPPVNSKVEGRITLGGRDLTVEAVEDGKRAALAIHSQLMA